MDTMISNCNTVNEILAQANSFISVVNQIELENAAALKSKEALEKSIQEIMEQNQNNKEALDIATHAIEILRQVSDEAVSRAYGFLEQSLNSALKRMFVNTTRSIKIKESIRGGQYPQLELELNVGNGITRSLKTDSGHGLAQIVSLLSILSLIVITESRRILVMDEVISGLSVHNRKIVTDILWSFTTIGFQFLVNDHGYIPEGSMVYHLEMNGDVSGVKQSYIATQGVYLQGNGKKDYDYKEVVQSNNEDDDVEQEEDMNITYSVTQENNDINSTTESNVISI